MRGDNCIKTSSLAGTKRARKASAIRKNGQIFEPKCLVYRCTFVTQDFPSTPIKRGSNGPEYEMRRKRQKKRERKREREKGGKNAGSNRKKKTKNKKISMRIHFPYVNPAP